MQMGNIIGIGGTDASGKDSVAEMLVERHGWLYVSVSDLLREELTRRKVVLDRKHLRELSAEWRRENGPAVLIEKAQREFESKAEKYSGLVIASLRHPKEADKVHGLGGKVVWTDADPRIRHQRLVSRNRGTEDQKTFEEFIAEENAQMQHSGDDATLNLSGVKQKADIFLENNGDDVEKFKDEAEKALAVILKA